MPRVSVILPVYNAERYLSEAIESILLQTFKDLELILLDDGSSDRSIEIAREAAASDCRVTIVMGNHRGYASWLNEGLDRSAGELIARMDADDISSHDRFAHQVRFLDAHPEYAVVGTQAIRIDPDGLPIDSWRVPEHHDLIDGQHMNGRPGAIIHPSVMMRKSAVTQIGGYRAAYEPAEDFDLFLRLAEIGRIANLGEALLKYRVHDRCVTFTRAEAQNRWTKRALEDAWNRRGRVGSPLPTLDLHTMPTTEEFMWSWALNAFANRNFQTARKHALRLLRRRPAEMRRWAIFIAACLGPLAYHLRRVCPYRVGPYPLTTN